MFITLPVSPPMNTLPAARPTPRRTTPNMQSLDLQGYSYSDRFSVLRTLTNSLTDSGAWITGRNTISSTITELRLEIQLRSVLELYIALLAAGLDLTRTAHDALTDLLTCHNNLDASSGSNIVNIRLEVNFLEDVTLHSLLMTGLA
jgi:hypothetical protein